MKLNLRHRFDEPDADTGDECRAERCEAGDQRGDERPQQRRRPELDDGWPTNR